MAWYYNLSFLDWVVFLLMLLGTMAFLVYKRLMSQSASTGIVEYMVMGRSLTLPMFVATLVATWYSGIFGVTQISFEHGIYNFITQGIFWYASAALFSLYFVKRARKSLALSFSEMVGNTYGKKPALITAILIFIKTLPIPYAIAIGLFISGFLNISLNYGIALGMVAATFYCLKGGMRATVISDILQFFLMFLSVGSVVVFSIYSFGGWEYLHASLPASHFSVKGNHNLQTVFVWLIVAISTTLLSPVFYQRCFAAKTTKIARKGILVSICFWVVCDIFTTLAGLYAKAHMPDADPANAFMNYSVAILPNGLRGFFMASILITLFSAIDSYLFLSSSVVAYDIFKKLSHHQHSRSFCIIATGLATVIASSFFGGNIERVWLLTESFFMACMIAPILFSQFLAPKISERGLCISIALTLFAMVLWLTLGRPDIVEPFYIGLMVNILSLAVCLLI